MKQPTYEEFCVARHLSNTRADDVGGRAYQVCRWYRGSMFIRQEAEIALREIRAAANRSDGQQKTEPHVSQRRCA